MKTVRSAPRHAAGIASLMVGAADPKFLQDFLTVKFSLTRRGAKAIIDGRNVWVNHKCVWIARYALKGGEIVELPAAVIKAAQQNSSTTRQQLPAAHRSPGLNRQSPATKYHIRVLWQNDNYLVCDKPAGMVSCDDEKSVEAVLREQEKMPNLEAVHRLDRDTTGCLMFAKSHVALEAAIEIFRTRKVSKTYHAIVVGKFKYAKTHIDAPLDGDTAITDVSREGVGDDASFLRIKIETGRTNQIRRHLSSIRSPIVGDRVFGLKSVRDRRLMEVPRQMLHASSLELPDPMRSGVRIKVHSPLPADFRSTLRVFGMGKDRSRSGSKSS